MTLVTATPQTALFQPDLWLTEALGFSAFALRRTAWEGESVVATRQLSEALERHAEAGERALFFAKSPTSNMRALDLLQDCQFRVIDVALTLARGSGENVRRADPAVARAGRDEPKIRTARSTDASQVEAIAATCFRFSRFHLDRRIPRALADRVKRRWAASYMDKKRGDRMWTAEVEGRVVGFLGAMRLEGAAGPCAVIDLVGVDPSCQRRGVGRALVHRFLTHYEADCREQRVGTQAANTPSLRLYQEMGFAIAESAYVVHRHTGGEGPGTPPP